MLRVHEGPAYYWSDPQNFKESTRDKGATDSLRQLAARIDGIVHVVASDPFERCVHAIPVLQAHRSDACFARAFLGLRHEHESIAIGEWQWSQQHGVDGGEDGRVGADAKRERQPDGQRETGSVTECADGVTDVTHGGIHPACDIHVTRSLALHDGIAELKARPSACLGSTGAFALEIIGALGEMKGDLALDVAFDFSRSDSIDQTMQPSHLCVPCRSGSSRTLRITKHASDAFCEAGPALLFQCQLLAPLCRERVEARFTVLLRHTPLGLQPALLFHPVKRRVERAFLDAQEVR